MMTQEEARKILFKNGIIYDPNLNLSQFGGLELFIKFLERGRFRERLTDQFGFYRARSILQIMLGLVVGAKSMNDIGKISKDPLIIKYLKNPVEEAQLGRDVRSFNKEEIQSFHDFNMGLSVFDFLQKVDQRDELIFDIDATAVEKYGEQEGVAKGYIGMSGDLQNCYQYLFFRLHNTNTFLYGTIREGSSHSQNDFCGYLERFLPMFKQKWKTIWRADSGYFNERAFELFIKNDADFFIKAPMSQSRLVMAQTSNDLVWGGEVSGVSYASRSTKTEKGNSYYEIFKRTRLENQGQLSLGEVVSYRYDCIATSRALKEESEAFLIYNGRANIENNIREMKNDYQLGRIVTDDFDANDIITQITLLTYLLVRHFQREALGDKMKKFVLSTLRNHVFNIPALFRKGQRRLFLKIKNVFVDDFFYARVTKIISKLSTWVVSPPLLQ
jgi:hypothetical protein